MKEIFTPEGTPKWVKILYFVILCCFIVPSLYYVGCAIGLRLSENPENLQASLDSFRLAFVQCLLGVVAIHVPVFFSKILHLKIPTGLLVSFYLFLFAGAFLGEVLDFYYSVPHFDDILHCLSSVLTGWLAFLLLSKFMQSPENQLALSPFFLALFAFCFSMTIGTIWELYEFACDTILDLNMQKSLLEDGTALIGKAALQDTMQDFCVDTVGALFGATFGYVSIRRKKGWIYRLFTPSSTAASSPDCPKMP